MAKATQIGQNRPNLQPVAGATEAPRPVQAANSTDAERLEKARAARIESIPSDERALMEEEKRLTEEIKLAKAANDAVKEKALRERFASVTKQRKGMSFVRKFGDAYLLAEDLAKRLTALTTSNYYSSPEQRRKAKMAIEALMVQCLREFDKVPELNTEGPDPKARKKEARRMAAALLS